MQIGRLASKSFADYSVRIQQRVDRLGATLIGLAADELDLNPAAGELAGQALLKPADALLRLSPGRRIVVLFDALDEIQPLSSDGETTYGRSPAGQLRPLRGV